MIRIANLLFDRAAHWKMYYTLHGHKVRMYNTRNEGWIVESVEEPPMIPKNKKKNKSSYLGTGGMMTHK